MPELPKVSQEFEADVSGYLRGIEEMIKAAQDFIKTNAEAIASVKALEAAIDDLHGKEIVITVRYVTEGNLPEVQNVTRVVNQVYRGDPDRSNAVQPVMQPVTRETSDEAFRGVESVRTVMTGSPRDSFKGTEFIQPELTGSVPDVFAGLEQITPILTKSVQDAFTGAESITPVLTKSVQDAFSGAESITPVLTGSIQDAFRGAEEITPVLAGKIKDAFQGVESISPELTGSIQDAFQGVEFVHPVLTGNPQEAFKGTENIKADLGGSDAVLAEAHAMNMLRDKYAEVFAAGKKVTQGQDEMAQAILRNEAGFARVLSDVDRMASQFGVLGAAVRAYEADMKALEDAFSGTETHTETFLAGTRAAAAGMKQAASAAQLLNEANGEVLRGQILASAAEAAGSGDTGRLAQVTRDAAAAGLLLAAAGGAAGGGLGKSTAAAAANRDAVSMAAGWWGRWGSVIHYVVMLTLEFLAVFIPAMVAAAAAMAVALQAAQDIQVRMSAVYTVAEALGPAVGKTAGQMVGLGNALQQAQNAMQPAVYEAFGGVLNALKDHFGGLWTMGENVIHMFDTFIAKLDVELKTGLGQQLSNIVSQGAQDLKGFGQELGNLGRAILNFASAMPGLAEVILRIIVAFTDLLKIISEIPAPILTAAFALEEFLRWGSLLINVGGRMVAAVAGLAIFGETGQVVKKAGSDAKDSAGSFGGLFSTIISFAASNPLVAIGVVAALALGGFAYWARKAKDGTDQWVASVDKAVTGAPDFSQINTTVKALGENTRHLADAQVYLNTKTSDWSRLASGAQQDFGALDRQHKQLTQDIFVESGNVALIANKYGVDIPTAIALAQAAGVKLTTNMQGQSTSAQVARQQIDNLITGYNAMGQQGNQLVASIDAVTIANSGQVANVGKLNTAWKTVIDMGTNVQVGFLTFAQGLNTISGDAKKAGASFDGLNGQSLSLRQDFQKNISNMSSSLQSMNMALSLGGVSWNQYRTYIASVVGEMLNAGNLSGAQVAQLGLIASSAGYTGSNYSALSTWVGKYATSQSGANDIINTATIKLSNLKEMTGRLQGALQSDVIDTTTTMVLGQAGFQAALSKTYEDFKKGGTASVPFRKDLKELDTTLRNAGFSQQQVTQYNQFLETQFKDTGGVQVASGALKAHQGTLDQTAMHTRGFGAEVKDIMDAMGHRWLTNMDEIVSVAVNSWKWIASTAGGFAHDVVRYWDDSVGGVKAAWNAVEGAAKVVWDTIYNDVIGPVKRIITDVKNFFVSSFDNWWKTHGDAIKSIWNAIWQGVVGIFLDFVGPIETGVKALWDGISGIFNSSSGHVRGIARGLWNDILGIVKDFWQAIEPIVSAGWTVIKDIFKQTFADIKAAWKIFWDLLKAIGLTIFDGIRAGIKTVWDLIVGIFNVFIDVITGHWHQAWVDIKNMGEQIWNAIKDFFGQAFDNFKAAFKDALNVIKATWDTDWNAIKNIVTTVWDTISRAAGAFWRDLKNGFRNAVDSLRNTWNELKNDFKAPVAFLVNTVYEGGIRRFWNDIMGFVGGPKLPPEHFAGGGRVPGYGGGDVVPAMLEAGEAVVPKHLVGQLAPFLAMHNIPGFAQGGLVNPIGPGLRGERVDMGVDYGGSGNLYALGSGTITNLFNSGWPGGGFIGLQLNPPYGSGYWYYAEDVIPWGNIHKGSGVRAGQQIAMATGGNTGIEVGWAAPPGTGQTAAARDGQQNRGGDPGAFPTAWGVAANTLIKSLGGPGGIVRGPVHGGTPGFGGLTSVFGSIIKGVFHAISGTISGLGDAASVISALATGNGTALSNAMSKFIGPGGAKGALAQMMVGIPKTLIGDAVKFVEHFVAGHTTTQTTGGGALPHGPIGKNVGAELAFAQSHLAGYGWGQPQMGPLINLWNKESGWNPFAVNPSSGAYGIPQALGHGHPYALGDYMAQIIWGLNYIKSTYGSPAAAWGHEVAHNWYDQGGWLMPGVTMAVNNTGRPERILGPGEGQNGTIEATFHVHTHMNGREIWRDVQKETFRYDMRNRGQVTGGLSNLDK